MNFEEICKTTDDQGEETSSLSDKSMNALVLEHRDMIRKIAWKYRHNFHDLTIEELCQIGTMGALHASRKFKPEKNYAYSTYAVWWIRNYILNAIADEGRTIRLPRHIHQNKGRFATCERGQEETLSLEQLSEKSGISQTTILENKKAMNGKIVSLDETVKQGSETGMTRMDTLRDDDKNCPEQHYIEEESWQATRQLLEIFRRESPEDYEVIKMAFGLDNAEAMNLKQIGDTLGIGRERVRLMKNRGLSKLRRLFKKMHFEG